MVEGKIAQGYRGELRRAQYGESDSESRLRDKRSGSEGEGQVADH